MALPRDGGGSPKYGTNNPTVVKKVRKKVRFEDGSYGYPKKPIKRIDMDKQLARTVTGPMRRRKYIGKGGKIIYRYEGDNLERS